MKRLLFLIPLLFLAATYGPPFSVSNISSLTNRPNPSATNPSAVVLGAADAYDGGGGIFIFDPAATNLVDNDLYFPATTAGRWIRLTREIKTATAPLALTNGQLTLAALTNYFSFIAGTNMQVTLGANSVTYAMTNTTFGSGGLSSNYFFWEGIAINSPNLKDTAYIYYTPSGTNLAAYIVADSVDYTRLPNVPQGYFLGRYTVGVGDTELLSFGANLVLNTTNGVLDAITGSSATNGTTVNVDGGSALIAANFIDSSELDPSVSGTNVTYAIVGSSIATNKVNSTFLHLLLNQYRVNNLTNWFLSITNNATDTGRVVWYTNSLGDYVAYATNLPAGGGSGSGTNAFVNGVLIQPLYVTNSATVTWATNANGHVQATATGGSGETNTASNLGTASATNQPLFKAKSGVDLQFRNVAVGPNLTLTSNANEVVIGVTLSTNSGTVVSVDGGGSLSVVNVADTTEIGAALSGTNLNLTINTGSIATNKIDATFHGLLVTDALGSGTNAFVNGVLMQPFRLTNNAADTGRIVWYTNAGGDVLGYATNISAGSFSGAIIDRAGGTLVTNGNLVSSANATVSISSGTNITYTFTGVGSATNGYLFKSATTMVLSNTVAKTTMLTFSLPANTLSEDGDELIINIPGRYSSYTGGTNGYEWELLADTDTASPFAVSDGVYPVVLPSISSAFSTLWEARIKRVTSNTVSGVTYHQLGADTSGDLTNVVHTARYLKDRTLDNALGFGAALEFQFNLTMGSAGTAHKFDLFGYTVVKVGSVGGGSSSGSVLVNGATVSNPNFTNSSTVTFSVANSTNVSASIPTALIGPGSSTSNAVVLFDGTTGKLGKNSTVLIDGNGAITGVSSATITNLYVSKINYGNYYNAENGDFWVDGFTSSSGAVIFSYPFSGSAIASGTVAQNAIPGSTNYQSISSINAAAGANSGYAWTTTSGFDISGRGPEFTGIIAFSATNNVLGKVGYYDAVGAGSVTDGAFIQWELGYLRGAVFNNSSATYTTTSNLLATSTTTYYRAVTQCASDGASATFWLLTATGPGTYTTNWTDTVTATLPGGSVARGTGSGITVYHTAGSAGTELVRIDALGHRFTDRLIR